MNYVKVHNKFPGSYNIGKKQDDLYKFENKLIKKF